MGRAATASFQEAGGSADAPPGAWRICIDTGGTFTDCLAVDPNGGTHRAKVLSSGALRGRVLRVLDERRLLVSGPWGAPPGLCVGWEFRLIQGPPGSGRVAGFAPAEGGGIIELAAVESVPIEAGVAFEVVSSEPSPIVAARIVTGTPAGAALPPIAMRLATTRGTNALLERRGSPVALFITKGFGDLLTIRTQQRPDIFALDIRRPEPLAARVVEVPARLAADGTVLGPLDPRCLEEKVSVLLGAGVRAAAVALMHSWIDPRHEQELSAYLLARGFGHVSCSAELSPTIKLLNRAETAVVNAYLAGVIQGYLDGVRSGLGRGSLHVMTSAGGLVGSAAFRPKDSLLSGPAGGVVGAAAAARRSGLSRVISFDMGGTSTDVARFDGDHEYVFEHRVGDAFIAAPAVAVESVAAGGGSVCWLDSRGQGGLSVGPQSAGADPGPACYGAGGPLTLTDANLLLGRLDPARFEVPLFPERARQRADELLAAVNELTGASMELGALLEGLIEIADERMAQAIRSISIQRGFDAGEHVLVAFGGAGGQHACGVASRLGITRVLIPADVGLLSAAGLGHAVIERFAGSQVLRPLDDLGAELGAIVRRLSGLSARAVQDEGVAAAEVVIRRCIVNLRLAGQESAIAVEVGGPGTGEDVAHLRRAFEQRYEAEFGYAPGGRPIEVESIRVVASSRPPELPRAEACAVLPPPAPVKNVRVRFGGAWRMTPVHWREHLKPGSRLAGPVILLEPYGTTVVPSGWSATIDAAGAISLDLGSGTGEHAGAHAPREVRQELRIGRLTAIASEMGEVLRRTALSTNVKERLDFSCAVLDAEGELIVNAPHIPVHLGALGPCVRLLRGAIEMKPGDVIVTNHPAFGGSHLPDVTVVTPVHDSRGELLGYVASRAHHAEIGGALPGSMPPGATTLGEEGVILAPMHVVRGGRSRLEDVGRLLLGGPHPTRAIADNIADLTAQIAANRRGADALAGVSDACGAGAVADAMKSLKERAERRIREALARFEGRRFEAEEELDDGSPIRVAISVAGGTGVIDFAGTSGVHPGNFNAPPGVVRSAVIYVLRLLIDEPLPLNEGLMRAIELRIPPGMLNPPFVRDPARCPAVGAGNVETSQRVVDTLLKALGLAACSQGTMNNVVFGNSRFGYYETVCGGSGAGPSFDGAHGVHTHMTNTRITDPEILEHRYPVRLERFSLRTGSGGGGRHRGGDGVVRELTFLQPVSLSVLTQHRRVAPYGLAGGGPGQTGAQRIVTPAGEVVPLRSVDSREIAAGERLILETPGGGGYGPA